MITDTILAFLVDAMSSIAGVLPRIPLGPFAADGSAWATLASLGSKLGWVGTVFPWTQVSIAVALVVSTSVALVPIVVVRKIVGLLRGGGA